MDNNETVELINDEQQDVQDQPETKVVDEIDNAVGDENTTDQPDEKSEPGKISPDLFDEEVKEEEEEIEELPEALKALGEDKLTKIKALGLDNKTMEAVLETLKPEPVNYVEELKNNLSIDERRNYKNIYNKLLELPDADEAFVENVMKDYKSVKLLNSLLGSLKAPVSQLKTPEPSTGLTDEEVMEKANTFFRKANRRPDEIKKFLHELESEAQNKELIRSTYKPYFK